MVKRTRKEAARLDEAARAGWLYYCAGNTQDEIATKLGVSRPSAQRLVSAAISEGLVKVRLDHPIARCMELAAQLCDRYGLENCDVVPTDPAAPDAMFGMAQAAAAQLERVLQSPDPKIIALGTGRAMRGMVNETQRIDGRHHKIVSLVGTIATDGAASFYDAVTELADLTRAPHYPLPIPVIVRNAALRQPLQEQPPMDNILHLAAKADVRFVGVGHLGEDAPLFIDGFISPAELRSLQDKGGIGELISWSFDRDGTILDHDVNRRVTSAPLQIPAQNTIGVAKGQKKVAAIRGAMTGKLITALITDEATAIALLS
ncbi:sugar-binding transcriptional regulator [Thalassospira sp.]|uniref:sugar-binding transcriptional regulator n=1 Tax=Thalassospira sp. TaxID=1912094 RepID=UPI002733C606|nr:sugar-binding transcriptional regulator [Thalassospira sp.]MDP2699543.1 sugar-binding transcriptional regulator [Thalassospira sp.]